MYKHEITKDTIFKRSEFKPFSDEVWDINLARPINNKKGAKRRLRNI